MRYSVTTKNPEHGVYDREIDCYYVKQRKTAFEGLCVVRADEDTLFGGEHSRMFTSEIMFNPTWRKIYNIAKKQQQFTMDEHHDFLEGIEDTGVDLYGIHRSGLPVRILRLTLGS